MATNTTRMDPGAGILVPALSTPFEHLEPVACGASLTIAKGQAMGIKTSDRKAYPFNNLASDGTQLFEGFSQYSLATDSNGLVYFVTGGTAAGATVYTGFSNTAPLYTRGVFSPNDVVTSATGTPVAEIDTVTPAGTITAADNFVIEIPGGNTVNFVAVSGSVTPTNIVTGLKNSWAADPVASALATASGTATLILTAKTAGEPMNLTTYCEGVGTFVNVVTAGTSAQQSEVDTFTPSSVTTGDVTTITITYPNATTHAVTAAAIGGTANATTWTTAIKAAWAADPVATAYAVATGTTTLILTAAVPGNAMSLSGAVVGTGTVAKVVTTPAYGQSITDIQVSRPGAYVENGTGFWVLP